MPLNSISRMDIDYSGVKSVKPFNIWSSLWLQPSTFFGSYVQKIPTNMFILANILLCIALSIDQLEKSIIKSELKGDFLTQEIVMQWPIYWEKVLLGSIFAIIIIAIASWWYGSRIRFSNGTAKSDESHRLYMYSSLIWGIPVIIITLLKTAFSPNSLVSEELNWLIVLDMLILIFPFYSVFVSYF